MAALPRLDTRDLANRIRLALACRDADAMPRVANAGAIVEVEGTACQVMHNGILVAVGSYHPEFIVDLLRLAKGVHEPQEELCFREVVQTIGAKGVMIEAGSYWSYYSLWFWQAVAQAQCHMIEVDAHFLEAGIRNFELNKAVGIFTHGGFGRPNLGPWYTGLHGNYLRALPSGRIFGQRPHAVPGFHRNIPLLTIDRYAADNAIETIDILHSDIQGEELNLLDGTAQMFAAGRVNWLFVSTHHNDAFHARCLERVEGYGLRIVAEHNISDSFSGDGLIVAKRPGVAGPDHIAITRRTATIF